MKVVHFQKGDAAPQDLREVATEFEGVELVAVHETDVLGADLADAEILVVNNRSYSPDVAAIVREAGSALRWIQFSTSGIDNGVTNGFPAGVVVTNVAGLRAHAVVEHAFMLMLALVRRLKSTEDARRREFWARDEITPSMETLSGKHLVLIGLGSIGQGIARRAKAFDMMVTGVSRSRGSVPFVDTIRPREDLLATCAMADVVVVATTYDPSTERIMGRAMIGAMKKSAYLVNIARGGLVDEDALVEALEAGLIAGAGLDVTATEPLPAGHRLWSLDNVVLTPHVGGAGVSKSEEGVAQMFSDNLRRWLRGEPLRKVVIARTT